MPISLTAEDQNEPAYDLDDAFVRSQWLMPSIVERVLIHQETDSVDPYELLSRLDMSDADRTLALQALQWNTQNNNEQDALHLEPLVKTQCGVLTKQECAKLRKFLDKRIVNDGMDNVDCCPDWQVNLTPHKLTKIIGPQAVDRLLKLPEQMFGRNNSTRVLDVGDDNDSRFFEYERVGIFIRLYERTKRPWMPFHRDGNCWTVNVALNNATDYMLPIRHSSSFSGSGGGGRLVALYNGAVRRIDSDDRQEGDATCHAGYIQHAVTAMMTTTTTTTKKGELTQPTKQRQSTGRDYGQKIDCYGRRYSMILFFHTAGDTA
ncbi:hypothetical protein ACA910_000574 [Epithemia clementina (nom. ined.)]